MSWLRQLIPGLCLGSVIGVLIVVQQISFATMIFSGEMQYLIVRGTVLTLTGSLVLVLCGAMFSSFRGMISVCHPLPAAVLVLPAAAALGVANSDGVFPTATAILSASTACVALFFLLVGKFKLTNLVRYIPFPVVAGFLSGTGWLLFKGGIVSMVGFNLGVIDLLHLFDAGVLLLWLPGFIYAILLMYVMSRISHFLVLPVGIIVGIGIFFLVLQVFGVDPERARELGFLFSNLPLGGLWPPMSVGEMQTIDWSIVASQIPAMLTVSFLSLIGLLLTLTGIDLVANKDIDMNRELSVNGIGNLIAGALGSTPGYSTLSLSMIGIKSGVQTRMVGLVSGVVILTALLQGTRLLLFMPKPVLGSILVLFGFIFFKDWIFDVRKRITRLDYSVILVILFGIAGFGFLQGVGFGLLLTVLIFVYRFSRVPVIADKKTGREIRSHKKRSIVDLTLLDQSSDLLWLYEFSSFIFFGSANTAADTIIKELEEAESAPAYVIMDCVQVDGFDASSINVFLRLAKKLAAAHIQFMIIEPGNGALDSFRKNTNAELIKHMHFFNDRNQALEQCEEGMLQQAHQNIEQNGISGRDMLFDQVSDDCIDFLARLEQFEKLACALPDIITEQRIDQGICLVRKGEPILGIYVIQWGEIAEYAEDPIGNRTCTQSLGSGEIVGFWQLQGQINAPADYEAKQPTTLYHISREALTSLEQSSPEKALAMYKQLLLMAGKINEKHSPPLPPCN